MAILAVKNLRLLTLLALASAILPPNVKGDSSSAINLAVDYLVSTQLFKGLVQVDLPTEISRPGLKILNIRVSGLDNIARGCSIDLSLQQETMALAETCVRIRDISASFRVQVLGHPSKTIATRISDFTAGLKVRADVVPGGGVQLPFFDVWLSPVKVQSSGIIANLLAKALATNLVREKLRKSIGDQLRLRIRSELAKVSLPS